MIYKRNNDFYNGYRLFTINNQPNQQLYGKKHFNSKYGPPTQLEVEDNKKITLYTKAKDLARIMNEFFINKVQTIVSGLRHGHTDLSGCKKIMNDKKISLSLRFVTVAKIRKLLSNLKNKTSSFIAVRI